MTGRQNRSLEGRRVLVVEDQYLVAEEMRRIVRGLGAEVIGPVARPAAALDILHEGHIDLALLDINLGDDDVYAVAEELLRLKVPFLFATGCEPWVIPETFRDIPRIDKPLTSKTLSDAVIRLEL